MPNEGFNLESRQEVIRALPEGWWRNSAVACASANWFHRHLLPMHFGFRRGGEEDHRTATGFLLNYRNYAFWITAGHFLRDLRALKADRSVRVGGVSWFDGVLPGDAAWIRISLETLDTAWVDDGEMDFAAIQLRPYYLNQIRANPEAVFLDETIFESETKPRREGLYLVGFPRGWQEAKAVHRSATQTGWNVTQAGCPEPNRRPATCASVEGRLPPPRPAQVGLKPPICGTCTKAAGRFAGVAENLGAW